MTNGGTRRPDRTAEGIVCILVSVTAIAFGDALVKRVSADLTVWQVFALRSAFALPCLAVLARATGGRLRPRSVKWVALRSALLIVTWLAYYAVLPKIDLAVAAVAIYTNPIFTSLLTALVLGERVTGRQWIGVSGGFAGVLAILRPGTDAFSWFVLLPVLAAAAYSLAMIVTRSKCQDEDPMSLALAVHVAFIVTGLLGIAGTMLADLDAATRAAYPFLLGDWAPMGAGSWALMAFLGALSAGFFLGVARAYQIAPPQIIATFDYGYLISAALWGFVFFAERPGLFTILGVVLIVAGGVFSAAPVPKRPNPVPASAQ